MSTEQIEKQLIEQLTPLLAMEAGAIQPETALQSLGMDSMKFVELMIYIEKEFGVELMSTDMQRSDLETPRALAASVARNL